MKKAGGEEGRILANCKVEKQLSADNADKRHGTVIEWMETRVEGRSRRSRSEFKPVAFATKSWLATVRSPDYAGRVMDILPRPDIILTHESDLDGLLSGILLQRLAHKLFNSEVRMEAYHYNSWKVRELREKAAWVCDFNFEARLDRPNWLIIDHHATDCKATKADLIHDSTKSAGLLCHELCKKNDLGSPELDRLVHLNNVADLFLEDDPDFVVANDYANLVKTYGFWSLHALIKGRVEALIDHPLLEVMAVKRRIEDPLGLAWSKGNVREISAGLGFVDTVVGNNNLIVHQLLEQKVTPFPVLMTMIRKSNGVVVVSLRSKNGEAIKIAAQLQGGGHPNACGATLPRSVRTIPDAIEYLKQLFNPAPGKGAGLNSMESLFAGLETKS